MDDVPQRIMRAARYGLEDLTLDEELQPRASIDTELLGEFGEAISAGDVFPPVTVVEDRKTLWLADGYHRWHAHKALDLTEIECLVFKGTRDEALRYSLQANARHGKRPTEGDYERAYNIAVAHEFIDACDVDGVVALLACSQRTAERLTQLIRAQREAQRVAERDAEIERLKAEGLSNRKVAAKIGLSDRGVGKILSRGANPAPLAGGSRAGPEPEDDDDGPQPVLDWMKDLPPQKPPPAPDQEEAERAERFKASQEAFSPMGQTWLAVLEALRAINALRPVEKLFRDRYLGFDHAVGPELAKASAWMEEFNRRFTDV